MLLHMGLAGLQAPAQVLFHVLQGNLQQPGHLGLGQAVDLVQDEDLAAARRQGLDGGDQAAQLLPALGDLLRAGLRTDGRRQQGGVATHFMRAPGIGPAQRVHGQVVQHAAQQAHGVAGIGARRALGQQQVGVMHHVARALAQAEAPAHIAHQAFIVAQQRIDQRRAGRRRL